MKVVNPPKLDNGAACLHKRSVGLLELGGRIAAVGVLVRMVLKGRVHRNTSWHGDCVGPKSKHNYGASLHGHVRGAVTSARPF